jgi:Spy/CpxP family protein refolding chaperone
MKRIALTLLALVSATSLFAQTADSSAADKPKLQTQLQGAAMRRSFWNRLHLTDDQKEKLKQIREADRDGLRSAWAQVKIAQETLQAALLANPENTADIQAKATALGNALGTRSVQFALHRAKINEVLTPAQRVVLYEARKNRLNRRAGFRGGAETGRWQRRRDWENREQRPRPESPAASSPDATPEAPAN